jgi:ssDNA-binding Zn-finger/Zn-ribbon topoisomerase 1
MAIVSSKKEQAAAAKKTAEFVSKARRIHGRRYDYSRVVLINHKTHVTVVCRTHGPFPSFPSNHLRGHGCKFCAKKQQALTRIRKAGETFIRKAKKRHGTRYEYSRTVYRGANCPVSIYCPKHERLFRIIANNHLQGRGCQQCGRENQLAAAKKKRKAASKCFVANARKIHGRRYNYSEVVYKDSKHPVGIRCLVAHHGVFPQKPSDHLLGKGCPKCGSIALAQRTLQKREQQFLTQAKRVHGNKYDYSAVAFKNTDQKITVICPKHGAFPVRPTHHTSAPYSGCPVCIESLGERAIRSVLEKMHIEFVAEKRFSECRDKRPLAFDFYLPFLNTLIEYDGEQHFDERHYLSTLSDFKASRRRDRIKTAYAHKKKIRLIRVKYSVRDVEAFLVKKLGLAST